ncbi:NAD(P)-dependent oxidoreductase [Microbacterium sp. T2.11-28]|uniref:NAD(P)-dependent oxidoreductase n=1 Tax=unclassified Microbacterium TaxID=2609290 RepID=UPI002477CA22|nr:NAD(P)-binding domain-containing protein [Microbacterium sp. T2.11-28]CAI9390284.1 2-hydroxy-3-oxopropionate reductase [Microbacterium sp. T2.11-28]
MAGASEAPRLGVLGVGTMGGRIALRAAERVPVAVFDRDPDRARSLGAAVTAVASAAALAERCDVVLVVLPDARAQREALCGTGGSRGLVEAMVPGALLVDLTGGDPAVSREVAERVRNRGCRFVAAPVRGGPRDAERGTLRAWTSGDPDHVDAAARVLAAAGCVAETTFAGSDPGAALTVKLLTNALWFTQAVASAEAVVAAQVAGIEPARFAALLADGPAESAFVRDYLGRLIDGDTVPDFALSAVVGQLDVATRLVADAGGGSGAVAAVRDVHRAALARYGPVAGELLGARHVLDAVDGRVPQAEGGPATTQR